MKQTDLIIIGAGPGGCRAAEYAAQNGLNVTIFEPSHLGGTCLNEGCIPTKSFARNAEVVQLLTEAGTYGLTPQACDVDFRKVVERKDEVLAALRSGLETVLSQPQTTLVRSRATFIDAHTVSDDAGTEYTAPNIIVATGSQAKTLPLATCERPVLDAADLLAADHQPRRLCIVGAGVIGMEFASIFSSFGTEVTVVEFLKECLPTLDSDIAKRLRKSLEKRGVQFFMQSAVTGITATGVTFERKGKLETVEADDVLMAVGRRPRTSSDFRQTGFEFDERMGIRVDDNMQTTVPGIYAIGDVNGRQMLAHAAEMQAVRAVNHILGRADDIRLDIMPAAVFTHPEAACVGLTEDQLKADGAPYACYKAFHRANGKAMAMNQTEGMLKLLAGPDDRILGCHAFGAHAADMVQEVSVLMCRDTTVAQLRDMVHIHPTLGEIVLSAVRTAQSLR